MAYRIVIITDEKPSQKQLRSTAISIWKKGNKKWSEFTVFIYLPEMSTDGIAYGIAEFRKSGLKDFRLQDYALYGTKWE